MRTGEGGHDARPGAGGLRSAVEQGQDRPVAAHGHGEVGSVGGARWTWKLSGSQSAVRMRMAFREREGPVACRRAIVGQELLDRRW
ncbi:hypothetical protein [Streptomyces microflavus]